MDQSTTEKSTNSPCAKYSINDIKRIGVFGCGTWGIALARLLALKGYDIIVWAESDEVAENMNKTHMLEHLPEVDIPQSIAFTHSHEETVRGAQAVLFVTSSPYIREVAGSAAPYITSDQILMCASKGIETSTSYTMVEVIGDELVKHGTEFNHAVVAVSGPTHAEEVARDMPSAMVAASKDLDTAQLVQKIFSCGTMRVYTDIDIKGVELCGAFKNVIALACGIAQGLGTGDNASAALMTRGVAEMMRLGYAEGCDERTFVGLAGVGDVIVTASSKHSRNSRAGRLIAQGVPIDQVLDKVGMVVEGLNAIPAVMVMMRRNDIDMPILETVEAIVSGKLAPADAVDALMSRPLRFEKDEFPHVP